MYDLKAIYKAIENAVKGFRTPVVNLIKVQSNDPFRILIATILSARTNDLITAKVTEKLFNKIKSFEELEKLSIKELEKLIYPVGFYKNKAKFLKALPKAIRIDFKGKIPKDLESLTKLPGVGRKTANLVLAQAFDIPAICVDTHVHRINNRLGIVKTKTPYETEVKLKEILPKSYWIKTNKLFVQFGQLICRPLNPRCNQCPIRNSCKYYKEKS
jgi:endonuclease III